MFKHIQKRLLLYFILISAIPLLAAGIFSYQSFSSTLLEKVNILLENNLYQIDSNTQMTVQTLTQSVSLIARNKVLRYTFEDGYDAADKRLLDDIFSQYLYDEDDILGIIAFDRYGGRYSFRCDPQNLDLTSMMMRYGKVSEDAASEELTWFGIVENPCLQNETPQVFLVGFCLMDDQNTTLATFYMLCSHDLLSSTYSNIDLGYDSETLIADTAGRILSQRSSNIKNLWEYSIPFVDQIYSRETGNFIFDINEKTCVITFCTSKLTGWKLIQVTDYAYYTSDVNSVGFLIATIGVISILAASCFAYLISKSISKPMQQLSLAMENVSASNFDVEVTCDTKDEIAMICNGFNQMSKSLKELFLKTVADEKRNRAAEIKALQYQINPHFLYNTIGAIRLNALAEKDRSTADMLLVLGRYLRNTLKDTSPFVTLENEINNLKDYIFIHQIRYGNALHTNWDMDYELMGCMIPKMILQPLVENSIIHGLNERLNKVGDAMLTIRAKSEGGNIQIEIYDNGVGIPPELAKDLLKDTGETNSSRVGVRNVNRRIRYQIGSEYGLSIDSKPGSYTQITVLLPKRTNDTEEPGDVSSTDC